MRSGTPLLLALLLSALAAAAPPAAAHGAAEPEPREIVVHVQTRGCPDDAAPCFSPRAVRAEPHERLRLVFLLDGQMPHRMRVQGNATLLPIATEGNQTLNVTAPAANGRLEFFCDVHPLTLQGIVSTEPEPIFTGALRARANLSHEDALTVRAVADGGPAAARYEWDWGDGARSEGANATHRYARGGAWQVTLTATSADGLAVSARHDVQTHDASHPFTVSLRVQREDCPDGATRCWTPREMAVPLHAPVMLSLVNEDAASHRIRVVTPPGNESAIATPGEWTSLTLPPIRAPIRFECPFHPTMRGVLYPEPMPYNDEGDGNRLVPAPLAPLTLLALALAARRRR